MLNKMRDLRLMSQVQTVPATLPVQSRSLVFSSVEAVSIPWAIWILVAGITISVVGGDWDLSWHRSIGRDTFWTPPHILIQMGAGVLVGIASAYAILTTTLAGASPARDASVQVLGLHAPGGAFIAVWGSLALFASAPFDNWWHNAYGLDANFASPPHVLVMLGFLATNVGAMAWMASIMNRSNDALRGRLAWLFLIAGSICVSLLLILTMPFYARTNMHTAECYLVIALFVPSAMIATGWGSAHKWGCTIVAAVYTGIGLGSEWLLPLVPAQPKLGPVYHNVTHLIPTEFPPLLIVPAFVADLLLRRLERRSSWIKAVWVGPAFVLSFLAVQWPFANFLMSPGSRNWIFGTTYFAYSDAAGFLFDPYEFDATEKAGAFLLTMAIALVASILTTRLGLAWGDWMRRIRR
jgi:hypothetical protein